jgi:hypothetical protein
MCVCGIASIVLSQRSSGRQEPAFELGSSLERAAVFSIAGQSFWPVSMVVVYNCVHTCTNAC